MKIHLADRERFACVHCPKTFPDVYHRNRHSATCKGLKPPSQIRSETGAELGLSIAKKRIQKRDHQSQQKKQNQQNKQNTMTSDNSKDSQSTKTSVQRTPKYPMVTLHKLLQAP